MESDPQLQFFSESDRSTPEVPKFFGERFTLLNLTEKWRFTSSGSYDFVRKEFAAPSVNIYRDLHCWEMNFTWFPVGFYRGYRVEIRLKAPQLQDLKITKQGSARGTYY